ncbi:P-loop containing nucleoside triphosphate hydrolase protein [Auriscalpium vulgare]|uniref:P-loop containing nucleoside triphosphate hydrolase protein n=1 Tax=Auriscalpium vulgare TaxID=40419 RepID=A0ACB8R6B6_9AGAM|nr:P-loop containing nucleoside triphosphate hydrolase protein [Auriscalpium vulgare]
MSASNPPSVDVVVDFIRTQHGALARGQATSAPPLFIALQGPQGSGKTFLTERVAAALRSAPSPSEVGLRVATLSIDDLYLPHDALVALAAAHPENALLSGRGQPGTHDVALGASLLYSLKHINKYGHSGVKLPSFDKSLFDGEGDRVPEAQWTAVAGPLDIVLLEGWCVGFYPQSRPYIERRLGEAPPGLDGYDMARFALDHVLDVNARLEAYVEWWDLFDLFVQIAPPDTSAYAHIYTWRLQQEHAMKANNGGRGMSDEQVKSFVDRYIPGYHFFGRGVLEGGISEAGAFLRPPWLRSGRLLRLTIGEDRELLNTAIIP